MADMPKLLYVWAAGSPPVEFPEGVGHVLNANQVLTLNMHYHPSGKAGTDSSKLGLYYTDKAPVKEYQTAVAIKPSLRVPADSATPTTPRTTCSTRTSRCSRTFRTCTSAAPVVEVHASSTRTAATRSSSTCRSTTTTGSGSTSSPSRRRFPPARWSRSTRAGTTPPPTRATRTPTSTFTFGEGTDDEMLVGFVDFVVKDGVRPAPVPVASELRRLMGVAPGTRARATSAPPA